MAAVVGPGARAGPALQSRGAGGGAGRRVGRRAAAAGAARRRAALPGTAAAPRPLPPTPDRYPIPARVTMSGTRALVFAASYGASIYGT